jgi:hypothetical protein
MTFSKVNHMTLVFGPATVFLSARSSTASRKGADKGIAGSQFDHALVIEGAYMFPGFPVDIAYPHTWLLTTLKPGETYNLQAAGALAVNVMAGFNFSAPVQVQLISISDYGGAIVRIKRTQNSSESYSKDKPPRKLLG